MPNVLNQMQNFRLRTTRSHGCQGGQTQRTYADLDNNGQYDRNVDMVVLTDANGDGKLTDQDAYQTSRRLNQMFDRRSPDLNGDGRVDFSEAQEARLSEGAVNRLDRNNNGILSGSETRPLILARDRNNDGNYAPEISSSRVHSLNEGAIRVFTPGLIRSGLDKLTNAGEAMANPFNVGTPVTRARFEAMKRSGVVQ